MSDDREWMASRERRRSARVNRESGVVEPLRQRLPRYLRSFGLWLLAILAASLVLTLVMNTPLNEAFGSTAILVGAGFLLVGGLQGGQYSNIGAGAVDAIMGMRYRRVEDPSEEDESGSPAKVPEDPRPRARRGDRTPPNPSAFWKVLGGIVLISLGVLFAG